MNLETAQQLSLAQRNLEMAQVALDSATELLRIAIASVNVTPDGQMPAVAKVQAALKRKLATQEEPKGTARKKVLNNQVVIKEFAAAHGDEFKADDLLAWARKQRYSFVKNRLRNAVHNAANHGIIISAVGKGIYKRVA